VIGDDVIAQKPCLFYSFICGGFPMHVDFSRIHQFFISMAHTVVLMLYRVSAWILLSLGYQGNDAACKLLAFVLVLFFLSFIFGLYWWPTRSAQPWLRVVLWPIIACLVLYTLFVFFGASVDVLKVAS
jgi:hypothetical protein